MMVGVRTSEDTPSAMMGRAFPAGGIPEMVKARRDGNFILAEVHGQG